MADNQNETLVSKAMETLGNICTSLVQNNILRNSKKNSDDDNAGDEGNCNNSGDDSGSSKDPKDNKKNAKKNSDSDGKDKDSIFVGGTEYKEEYLKNAIEAFENSKKNAKKNSDEEDKDKAEKEAAEKKAKEDEAQKNAKKNSDEEDEQKKANTLRNSYAEVNDQTSYAFSKKLSTNHAGSYGRTLSADLTRGKEFYND